MVVLIVGINLLDLMWIVIFVGIVIVSLVGVVGVGGGVIFVVLIVLLVMGLLVILVVLFIFVELLIDMGCIVLNVNGLMIVGMLISQWLCQIDKLIFDSEEEVELVYC